MKVILLKDVKRVGKKQEIVEVKDGYANNYLIPNGLAVMQTSGSMQVLSKQKDEEAQAIKLATEKAKQVAEKLKDIVLEFEANCGSDGKMFGTISTKQVEEELKAKHNIQIDKRKFITKEAVDHLGYTKLEIELYKGVTGIVTVHVNEKK